MPDNLTPQRIRDGLNEIMNALWKRDEHDSLVLTVTDLNNQPVKAYLTARQWYCDRGHFMFQIDGDLNIDEQDGFPRYFFSEPEADDHVRTFLAWRMWKKRRYPSNLTLDKRPVQARITIIDMDPK